MSILRLYIDETWPANPACDWVLLGKDGQPASEGRSEPRHWPAAQRCEVVLAGSQCVWLTGRLPKASKREQERLLRFAFEDQLVLEPDSQHLTLTDHSGDTARVIVIARDRLRQIVAQLAALGRTPAYLRAELEGEDPAEGVWQLDLASGHGVLRGTGVNAFAFDLSDTAVPIALGATVAAAREANRLPATLVLRRGANAPAIDPKAWQDVLGVPVESGSTYRWTELAPGSNLLHGEFRAASQHGAVIKQMRPALWLLGSVIALNLLVSLGEVLWQRHQISDARTKMQTVFKSAFPNQPLVDAPAQMRSQLNQVRRAHGLLGDDDLVALLASVGEALGADARDALGGLKYESGRLELTLAPQAIPNTDAIIKRLQARGLTAGRLADGKLALRRETNK